MRLLALLCAAWTAAAQAPAGDDAPVFRTTTRVVEMSVQADWPGHAQVRELTARDLHLFDNNKPQDIKTLERVASPANRQGTEHRAERRSILLFDALNTGWGDQALARQQAAKTLARIPDGETIAILLLAEGQLKLVHDFSSDRAALEALIRRLSGVAPKAGGGGNESPFSAARSTFRANPAASPAEAKYATWAQRERILQTLSALKTITRMVKGVPGQKNLLWLSAAFPLQINLMELGDDDAAAVESFYEKAVETTRELNAANVTIYPIDARGLMGSFAPLNTFSMIQLAELTGGKAFYHTNDLAGMIRAAIEDSREGYVLTYSPSDLQDDGKYHTIRLRCEIRGVRLRYRQGYWADAAGKSKKPTAPDQ